MTGSLTPRQRQVLDLLVLGWSSAEMGERVVPRSSEAGVKRMLHLISRHAGFPGLNRVQLAVWWAREQSASEDPT